MQLLIILALSVLALSVSAHAEGEITLLDHLMKVNDRLCDTLITCKAGAAKEQCVAQMNMISQANPANKAITITTLASDKCLASLNALTCDNALEKTATGDCDFMAVAAGAVTAPTPPATGDKVEVEFNNTWHPAEVLEVKDAFGVNAYRIKYTESGLEEWIAPNRLVKAGTMEAMTVGENKYAGGFSTGKTVQVEYNGGWYPATLMEEKDSYGAKVFRIKYTQSGLEEWAAANRVKD